MSKHGSSGPGKLEKTFSDKQDTAVFLLFNFDIESAVLKPEHKKELQLKFVPVLTANSRHQAFLVGTASRSGKNDFNKTLSEARVRAVESFLRAEGVGKGQLHTTALGELPAAVRGAADGSEDDRDRGVVLTIRAARAITPAEFDRVDILDNIDDGFDEISDPHWLMLPFEDRLGREMRLFNAQGLTLEAQDTTVARVELVQGQINTPPKVIDTSPCRFRVAPGRAGSTSLVARNPAGKPVGTLDLHVLARRTADVAFHLVEDSRNRKPAMTQDQVAAIFKVAQRVWQRQANIRLRMVGTGATPFRIDRDLGDPVSWPGVEDELIRRVNPGPRFNVFLFWDVQNKPGGTGTLGVAKRGGRVLGLDDLAHFPGGPLGGVDGLGAVLAHEFGHNLGLNHTTENEGEKITARDLFRLMHDGFVGKQARKLTRAEVLKARDNL